MKLDSYHERDSSHFKDKLWFPTKWRVQNVSSQNQCINIVYPSGNNPFLFVCHENKLDSIHEGSSSRVKDELWFPTKLRVQMVSSRNQPINIMYPNENYPFLLVHHDKKLYSCHERSSSRFKEELWFATKWRVQMVSSWNQCLSILYPNGNYPLLLFHHEKKIDSCHKRSSSCFKDVLWFPTKLMVQMVS